MNYRIVRLFLCIFLLWLGVIAGCRRAGKVAPAEPTVVPVSQPVQREVTEYADFTGRTDAIEAVDIRARVTGYLVKTPFKEGSEVKEGDLLFQIDPRPYQAQLDQAEGQVKLYTAQLKLARTTLARDMVVAQTPGAVSLQQLDQDRAAVDEAEAAVKAAQASMEVYTLNLEFAKVTSPINGQVSRFYLTRGNLVNQDQTLLTTVVSLDPMYVYFDVDEAGVLRVRRAINAGAIKPREERVIPILMGLQGEDGYPHEGTLNFVNNQVNPTTGSMSVRAIFTNPLPPHGTRLMSPGMFVRVRLPIGPPHQAILVIDRAIASDQGQKYVYVVDAESKVQYRRVKTGPLEDDGLRVIEDGLKPDDWVVVGGLQQVRPKMVVKRDETPMPSHGKPMATDKDEEKPSEQSVKQDGAEKKENAEKKEDAEKKQGDEKKQDAEKKEGEKKL